MSSLGESSSAAIAADHGGIVLPAEEPLDHLREQIAVVLVLRGEREERRRCLNVARGLEGEDVFGGFLTGTRHGPTSRVLRRYISVSLRSFSRRRSASASSPC